MKSDAILILGSKQDRALCDALLDFGFEVLVRESIAGAIEKLRTDRFLAIVADAQHTTEDVLEFVLNIRDFDESIPILVTGPFPVAGKDKTLLSRLRVAVVHRGRALQDMGKTITRLKGKT